MIDELAGITGVVNVSASGGVPGIGSLLNYRSDVRSPVEGENSVTRIAIANVDPQFLEVFRIDLLAGRDLRQSGESDMWNAFLVNEAAVKMLGWQSAKDAVGEKLQAGRREGTIVGVTKDFHLTTLHEEVEPLVMQLHPSAMNTISLRIAAGDPERIMSAIEERWRAVTQDRPFQPSFLESQIDSLYRKEQKAAKLFGYFAILAVLTACLGLFGLTGFVAEQRKKEIAIRKVMGASTTRIIREMMRYSLGLVVLAVLVASPIAYMISQKWLEQFAYRVDLTVGTFLLAAAGAILLAMSSTFFQAIKAATARPVLGLRYD